MFAVVRTGGKQYRVAAGDKIVIDKIDGEAGARIALSDVLFAGNAGEAAATAGLSVAAEIIAQAKADKVIVFKKKRRHNYRRKNGHRQQHTILRILSVGDEDRQGQTVAVEPMAAAEPMVVAEPMAPAEPMVGQDAAAEPMPADATAE